MSGNSKADPSKAGTESFTTRYWGVESWPDDRILETIFGDQLASLTSVRECLPALATAAQAAQERLRGATGRLLYAGAGTSARLAVQDGVELVPTYGWPPARLGYLIAGGDAALTRSIEGVEDDRDAAAAQVARPSRSVADDVLIAVSASGTTPYTVAACRGACAAGALTIAIANNEAADPPLSRPHIFADCDHAILAATGPEPIAGSTRMKAGTAQKIILNLLSDAADGPATAASMAG